MLPASWLGYFILVFEKLVKLDHSRLTLDNLNFFNTNSSFAHFFLDNVNYHISLLFVIIYIFRIKFVNHLLKATQEEHWGGLLPKSVECARRLISCTSPFWR